jgi:hypothetical protein
MWFALRVGQTLTGEDALAIAQLQVDDLCRDSVGTFDKEIACLSAIQSRVQSIGTPKCPGKGALIEPAELLRRNYGCCFDRARFIEKAARAFGYETRHLFLIDSAGRPFLTNLLPLGQESHATSEVLTSRGWLGVDSTEPFILVDTSAEPYTYGEAMEIAAFKDAMRPSGFYSRQPHIVFGLYSRHGYFHGVDLPGPEFVPAELLHNF